MSGQAVSKGLETQLVWLCCHFLRLHCDILGNLEPSSDETIHRNNSHHSSADLNPLRLAVFPSMMASTKKIMKAWQIDNFAMTFSPSHPSLVPTLGKFQSAGVRVQWPLESQSNAG